MELIIGSHVSYKSDTQLLGSVKEALRYGENTFMFYTGAPQNTRRGVINDGLTYQAYQLMKENGIKLENVIVHAPYIVNLCNDEKFDFSVNFLKNEMERCEELGMTKLVLHPGSSVGLERNHAISNIIKGLNIILSNQYKVGICLDTCHIHDAGYDLSNFDQVLEEFDQVIGLAYLKVIHVNDSKNIRGSHKDRHENIGFGEIGFNNLMNVIYHSKLDGIPKILETPYIDKEYPPYKEEIEMIKSKKFNEKLVDEVRENYP